jgi:protein-S-isoprenylcysteine O-methyltransferase Ste14
MTNAVFRTLLDKGEKGMRMNGFDRRIVWYLIYFIVGSAIIFVAGLAISRIRGRYMSFRKLVEEEAHKITKEQAFLGLCCAIFPAGGLGLAYAFKFSFLWEIIMTFLGFLVATTALALGIWKMMKKEKT